MRARDLFCALALLASAAHAAQDCLPWQQGSKPAAVADEETARKYLRDAVREHASDTRLHAQLGQMLFDAQCYDLALSEMLRARRLGENSPDFLLRLASAENILGAFSDAAADADSAAALPASARQRASAAALAGVAFESMGEDDSAVARFRRSLELAPDLENSVLMLADLLAKKGLKEEAAAALEKFTARNPALTEPWARLAGLHLALGDPARAVACWTRVRQLSPDYPMLDSMLAQAMLAGRNPDLPAVLRVLERAKQKTPGDSDLFYLEGRTLVAMGRYHEAAKSFQAAIRLQPLQSTFYYQLGLVYRKLGQADLAHEQFEIVSHLRSARQGL
jgi:tetratricopeptide (TPR) repeat protein